MKEKNAILLLLSASILWGITFAFQNRAAEIIGPGMFNGIRMIIGFIVLLPLTIRAMQKHKGDKQYFKSLLSTGAVLGLIISAASYTQQFGIGLTTAGKAGFITSLYSLFVPVFAFFIGKQTSLRTWICVGVGLCGAFLLSINGYSGISLGDGLIFVCAILFALQIIVIDIYGKNLEGVDLSAFQFLFGGLFSLILGFTTEKISFEIVKDAMVPLLYSGICSCGIAYTFQIIGQKYLHPAKATLVLSLESVWAAVGGFIILHETMTIREVCGCALLFAAVIISQLPSKKIN